MMKKNKYSMYNFFGNYSDNFMKLTILNLSSAVILLLIAGGLDYLSEAVGGWRIPLLMLLIPLTSPLFAGISHICLKVTRGEQISLLRDMKKGIRENIVFFLVDSVILYIISLGLIVSFMFYRSESGGVFITAMTIMSIIFAVTFAFFEFSFVTMYLSVELKMGDYIKNSVMLVLMGFWNHVRTIFFLAVILVIMFISGAPGSGNGWFLLIPLALGSFFLPVLIPYLVIFDACQVIEKEVIIPFAKENYTMKKETVKEAPVQEVYEPDPELLAQYAKGNPDEYVYIEGRMLRRSAINRMLEEKAEKQ